MAAKIDTIKHYAGIGSISHGTMRSEDLIPCFLGELEYLAKQNNHKQHLELVKEIQNRIDTMPDYYNSDDAQWDLNESLFDALNEYAMPYFYFGSHPGDGSDYGFWLSEYMAEDFDGLKVEDTSDIPQKYTGEVLHVNDHGNLTLYFAKHGKLTEIWAIV